MAASTTPRNVRLDAATSERLERLAGTRGAPQATIMAECVREGIAMREHPGIVFRDGPSGRRAAVDGGPDVWEIAARAEAIRDSGDPDTTRTAISEEFALPTPLVEVALRYWTSNIDEIAARIGQNTAERDRLHERRAMQRRLLSPQS